VPCEDWGRFERKTRPCEKLVLKNQTVVLTSLEVSRRCFLLVVFKLKLSGGDGIWTLIVDVLLCAIRFVEPVSFLLERSLFRTV
jgi:hypothetical protein